MNILQTYICRFCRRSSEEDLVLPKSNDQQVWNLCPVHGLRIKVHTNVLLFITLLCLSVLLYVVNTRHPEHCDTSSHIQANMRRVSIDVGDTQDLDANCCFKSDFMASDFHDYCQRNSGIHCNACCVCMYLESRWVYSCGHLGLWANNSCCNIGIILSRRRQWGRRIGWDQSWPLNKTSREDLEIRQWW